MITEIYLLNLLICILNQLPKECSLWVDDYILNAFADGWLNQMKDYQIKIENYRDFFETENGRVFFDLSPECLDYFKRELLRCPPLINYFCHYGIVHPDRKFLRVYDETLFEIDSSINVPEWLIHECAQHKIYVS